MGFYGQGYSVSRFLVEMGGRPRFLQFVRDGQPVGLGRRHPEPLSASPTSASSTAPGVLAQGRGQPPARSDAVVVRVQSTSEP